MFISEEEKRTWAAAEELDKLLAAMRLSHTEAATAAARLYGSVLSGCLSEGCDIDTQNQIINIVAKEMNQFSQKVVGKTAGLIQCGSTFVN